MDGRKRAGLTRPTIIEAGLRLLNEVGLEGLTVRRLADDLDVQSPALYWHFRTKQELLDGMADAIVSAPEMGPPHREETWRDWLLRRTRAYRRSLLAHRDGARLVATARMLSPATVQAFDRELTALTDRGFPPTLALHTITALSRYVTGFVLQEQTEQQEEAAGPADRRALLADLLGGEEDSTLMVALHEGGETFWEGAFEHGLQALLDGTAAALDRLDEPQES